MTINPEYLSPDQPMDNTMPDWADDDLIQVHGHKFHLYDEEQYEPLKKRTKGAEKSSPDKH